MKWLTRGGLVAALLLGGAVTWGLGWRGLLLLLASRLPGEDERLEREAEQARARQAEEAAEQEARPDSPEQIVHRPRAPFEGHAL